MLFDTFRAFWYVSPFGDEVCFSKPKSTGIGLGFSLTYLKTVVKFFSTSTPLFVLLSWICLPYFVYS